MMKCGVVTVYGSENCGSYLQAYAVTKCIEKFHKQAVCVEYSFWDNPTSRNRFFKNIIKAVLRGNLFACKQLRAKRSLFKEARKRLNCERPNGTVDCYVLGSDTIWDVSTSFFRNHTDFFWGTRFKSRKVISYAPSVGFAKAEDIEKCDFIWEALRRMSAVSVRDETAKELLQPYCDKEIQVVCDPTYLLERAEYDAIAKPTDLKEFLFIYYYGKMSSDYKEAIQRFAKQKGLKTVTFGSTNPWCDVSLAYDPLLFLSIYDKADYIITNTFHGTVFATIYEKRFAVVKNDKPKVLNVLKLCEMSDKMTNTADDVAAILESDFCYEVTRQMILIEREKGIQYLKAAIEG